MKRAIIASLSLLIISFQPPALADKYKESVDKLCKKMQVCMREQVAQEEFPPEMAAMVEGLVDNACATIIEMEEVTRITKEIEKSAIACFESMANQNCAQIEDGFETPACDEFNKQLEEY